MRKRFLHVCKNPICQKEFGILYDKAGQVGAIRTRCPHCKRLNKVELPVGKKKKKRKSL